MYVYFPGFFQFNGMTSTEEVMFLKHQWQRALVFLGGLWAELVLLSVLLIIPFFPMFILQIMVIRVLFSSIFNLNFLSTKSDGHSLISDLLGFPTFKPCG